METVPEKRDKLENGLAREKKLEQTILNLGPEKSQVLYHLKSIFKQLCKALF